jgi:uncharacterized protein YjbI with pentapeptide repeats
MLMRKSVAAALFITLLACTGNGSEPSETPAAPSPTQVAGVDRSCKTSDGENYAARTVRDETFRAENLDCAEFKASELNGVTFDGTQMSLGDFRGARLVEVTFKDVNLNFSNFQEAVLIDVSFVATNLYRASFIGADVRSARFSNTSCPDGLNSDDVGGSCRGHGVDDPS